MSLTIAGVKTFWVRDIWKLRSYSQSAQIYTNKVYLYIIHLYSCVYRLLQGARGGLHRCPRLHGGWRAQLAPLLLIPKVSSSIRGKPTDWHLIRYIYDPNLYLFQDTLTEYLKTIDCTIGDFYQEVKATQDKEVHDPYLAKFIECLLASAGEY